MVQLIGGRARTVRFGTLRLWADRGLIHIEDEVTNTYDAVPVKEALLRVQALQDMCRNTLMEAREKRETKEVVDRYFRALNDNQKIIEQIVQLCHQAREQGLPTDDGARRELARRRPTSLVVPALPSFSE